MSAFCSSNRGKPLVSSISQVTRYYEKSVPEGSGLSSLTFETRDCNKYDHNALETKNRNSAEGSITSSLARKLPTQAKTLCAIDA